MSDTNKNIGNTPREQLLLRMYDQMFNDINRHITVVWQSITVLVGSPVLLAVAMQGFLPIDVAEALIILLVGWFIATLYDSAYWYNRNLVIIANIERQFLRKGDLRLIHYYFGIHRAKYSMLTHLRIQWRLGLFIGSGALLHHFLTQALPMCSYVSTPVTPFRMTVILPYLAVILAVVWCRKVRKQRIESYNEFIKNSPGKRVDTTGIEYGVGHPTEKNLTTERKADR